MLKVPTFSGILSLNLQHYHLASLILVKKENINYIKIGLKI